MARASTDIQADITALRKNMAKGVKRLRLGNGEEVEFDSYAEMRRRLADLEAELAGSGAGGGFVVDYLHTSRGL